MASKDKVRLTLELSEDVNQDLEEIADESGSTKSEVLRKAIALVKAASDGKRRGRELALIDPKSEKVVTRIVGL